MPSVEKVEGSNRTFRIVVDDLSGGWETKTFPHLLPANKLSVADNVVFTQDGLVSKRPGNVVYGSGTGKIGSGVASLSMSRFYFGTPPVGQLLVQSNGAIYKGNDVTGAFTSIDTGYSTSNPATFAQMYDGDMTSGAATAMFICDGARVPRIYDGTHVVSAQTGGTWLPNGRSGSPITPAYCTQWDYHMVYAGEPTEPTGVYISDALRPESFTGYVYQDTGGTQYTPYYPAGRDGSSGPVTGIAVIGAYLVVFFQSAIYAGINTGAYGATQYQWYRVSGSTGCTSPRSIVVFDTYIIFFGGDGFYATDAQTVSPLPNDIPTVTAVQKASLPAAPEIANRNTVVGVRRSNQYWGSYQSTSSPGNYQDRLVVFDLAANGGWQFGAALYPNQPVGGAWSRWPTGMTLSCAFEARGPGDAQQLYWGSGSSDQVAIHDTGVYSDFGSAIGLEIRSKSYFLDAPASPKLVQKMWLLLDFYGQIAGQYTVNPQGYVFLDNAEFIGPAASVNVVTPGTEYGVDEYGTSVYASSTGVVFAAPVQFPNVGDIDSGFSVAFGVTESSTNSFNCLGFVGEVTKNEPAFSAAG